MDSTFVPSARRSAGLHKLNLPRTLMVDFSRSLVVDPRCKCTQVPHSADRNSSTNFRNSSGSSGLMTLNFEIFRRRRCLPERQRPANALTAPNACQVTVSYPTATMRVFDLCEN
jgi:hypothetical protein